MARRDGDGRWVGFLHRDNDLTPPSKGWANHATVMGYYLHRIKDERSVYRGVELRGGTHSFLRTKTWHVAEVADDSITYRITPDDFTATEYPLRVSLDLTYSIAGDDVQVRFVFSNAEPQQTAHVGFGLHPGFAAESFESFQLTMPPGTYRRHFSPGNYLTGETEDIVFAGGRMPFDRAKLPGSYILEFVDVPERTFTFSDPATRREVRIAMNEAPYVTLWSDGGAFLCIEPCWGLTDHHEQRAFEDKEGIQTIPAGGTLARSFTMTPRLHG